MLSFDSKLEEYVLAHTDQEGEVLEELNRFTHVNILNPSMLSGHLQGKILEMISRMISPERILEIGTYTGYSAICLAKGLTEGGKVITLDINDELEEIRREYIKKAGMEEKIEMISGNALELIPSISELFDLVFIDGEKEEYISYYSLVIPKIRPGGYILVDNVLWSGKVLEDKDEMDKPTKCICEFNDHVNNDPRVCNLILPVRDGLMVIRKEE